MLPYVDSYAPIVSLLAEKAPETVIEIGPGWGKFGLACREYLPLLTGLHALERKELRRPTQNAIYDWVYTGEPGEDAFTTKFWGRWNAALLINALDTTSPEDGRAVLQKILDAGTDVLVAVPMEDTPWSVDAFEQYDITDDFSNMESLILWLRA